MKKNGHTDDPHVCHRGDGQPALPEDEAPITIRSMDYSCALTLTFSRPICAICRYEAGRKMAVRLIENHIPSPRRKKGSTKTDGGDERL